MPFFRNNQRSKRSDTSECPLRFPSKWFLLSSLPRPTASCIATKKISNDVQSNKPNLFFSPNTPGTIIYATLKVNYCNSNCFIMPPRFLLQKKTYRTWDLQPKRCQGSKDPNPPSKIHQRSRPHPRCEIQDASHTALASPQPKKPLK